MPSNSGHKRSLCINVSLEGITDNLACRIGEYEVDVIEDDDVILGIHVHHIAPFWECFCSRRPDDVQRLMPQHLQGSQDGPQFLIDTPFDLGLGGKLARIDFGFNLAVREL